MRERQRSLGSLASVLLVAVSLVAGCGEDGRTERRLSVGVGASFVSNAGPPRAVGYQVVVVFLQMQSPSTSACPKLPKALRLLVNGEDVAPAFDDAGCLNTQVASALLPRVGTITADVKDGDETLAHAEFDGLAPGAAAKLVVPADGQVHAGDEIVIVPPRELPTGEASLADFYPLDDASVAVDLYASGVERRADGVHMQVPAFSGRAAVTAWGWPYSPQATYSCPGFDFCVADTDHTLGPVFITEGP
jgi:hypothetical protein